MLFSLGEYSKLSKIVIKRRSSSVIYRATFWILLQIRRVLQCSNESLIILFNFCITSFSSIRMRDLPAEPVSCSQMFLKIGVLLNTWRPAPLLKRDSETPTQVFSCEFWEISKKTFLTEHLWTTASSVYLFFCLLHNFFSRSSRKTSHFYLISSSMVCIYSIFFL